jgi:hypothetical protein
MQILFGLLISPALCNLGINIVGILPRASGEFRFLFVMIDTFTEWMEAMPVINITHEAVVKFL